MKENKKSEKAFIRGISEKMGSPLDRGYIQEGDVAFVYSPADLRRCNSYIPKHHLGNIYLRNPKKSVIDFGNDFVTAVNRAGIFQKGSLTIEHVVHTVSRRKIPNAWVAYVIGEEYSRRDILGSSPLRGNEKRLMITLENDSNSKINLALAEKNMYVNKYLKTRKPLISFGDLDFEGEVNFPTEMSVNKYGINSPRRDIFHLYLYNLRKNLGVSKTQGIAIVGDIDFLLDFAEFGGVDEPNVELWLMNNLYEAVEYRFDKEFSVYCHPEETKRRLIRMRELSERYTNRSWFEQRARNERWQKFVEEKLAKLDTVPEWRKRK